jgi:hypothetical protein
MQLQIAEEVRLASKLRELESIDENADQMHTNSPAAMGRHPADFHCDATCGPASHGDDTVERNNHRRFKNVPAQKNRPKSPDARPARLGHLCPRT